MSQWLSAKASEHISTRLEYRVDKTGLVWVRSAVLPSQAIPFSPRVWADFLNAVRTGEVE